MKFLMGRYLNEIVGLTVMLLMTAALVAGQADATVHDALRSDARPPTKVLVANLEAVMESALIRADVEIELDLDRLLEIGNERAAREAAHQMISELIEVGLDGDD